jgi:multidrug efflux system outer membrane protein
MRLPRFFFAKQCAFFIILGLASACSVGPDYTPPIASEPAGWKNSSHTTYTSCKDENGEIVYLDHWWEIFDDERLNALEQEALQNNRDLYVAYHRTREARALMNAARASFYPQVNLNPQYSNTSELIQLYGVGSQNTPIAANLVKFIRAHELFYFMPLNLSYEVDLWGKIRDFYDSAKYHYAAQIKDYEFVMLSLTADLAIAYYQLRAADRQLDLLSATLETRQKAFEINQSRYEEEVIFYADVTLAGEEVSRAKIDYEEVLRQRGILENQIAVLVGAIPSEFCLEHLPLEGLPPAIPGGIPSEVLTRRPDIQEAELNAKSQHALVKEAYTEFYPSLVLTSTGGFESPVLKYFLEYFSRYWMIGANSNQVVFDGGRLDANLQRQIAIFLQTAGTYQQNVLKAFQEVENALSDINNFNGQYEESDTLVAWAQKSYDLYKDRYAFGLNYYIDVVNTERSLLSYQMNQNQLLGFLYLSTIQLIKALGGGWSSDDSIE